MNITICGGGNLGHVCAGFLGTKEECHVSLLTTHPDKWVNRIKVDDPTGKVYWGRIEIISSSPQDVIPQADIILLCLPGFAIRNVLNHILPCLKPTTWVGTVVSSSGFFFEAMNLLPKSQLLFGFQRVPFISRIINYGHRAELKGYKESLGVAVEQTIDKEKVRKVLEQLFNTPTKLLDSYYEVSLSNSNPLLHTARLYTLWRDWKPGMSYDYIPFFYADWTVEASELLIAMDEEFQVLLKQLGLKEGCIPTVLDYYDSWDVHSLTRKISTIPAFQGILSPMIVNTSDKFEPDFSSRYFTEDFPYGMRFIVETANRQKFEIETIKMVYEWGMNIVSK